MSGAPDRGCTEFTVPRVPAFAVTCPSFSLWIPLEDGKIVWGGAGRVPDLPPLLSLAACGGRATRCR